MPRIKEIPSDFIVEEVLSLPLAASGPYSYYSLRKTDYTTIDAVIKVATAAGISHKVINFAGTKDRRAVTSQYLSIRGGPKRGFDSEGISLTYLGQGEERLNLGSLDANRFKIIVRDCRAGDRPAALPAALPNYFGSQRFGRDGGNVAIGKLLLKRRFNEAAVLIASLGSRYLPKGEHDPIRRLRAIPRRLLSMYIHAFQSDIWNRAVSSVLRCSPGVEVGGLWFPDVIPSDMVGADVPILGFDDDLPSSSQGVAAIVQEMRRLLSEQGVSPRDFIFREIPEISSDGGTRPLAMDLAEIEILGPLPDERNPGSEKWELSFRLGKGSYATIALTALFGAFAVGEDEDD